MRCRWKAACIARSGALKLEPAAPGLPIDCVSAFIGGSGALELKPAAPGLFIDCASACIARRGALESGATRAPGLGGKAALKFRDAELPGLVPIN